MNTGLLISARMNSLRLPGKVMMEAAGVPLLTRMLRRLKYSSNSGNLILATTTNPCDDSLEAVARAEQVKCYRGDENNVLKRMVQAARFFSVDLIVRLYGDSPLVDPATIDRCVDIYKKGGYDLVTTKFNYPMGIDCEVVSTDCLESVMGKTSDSYDLEHVTSYIWKHRNEFRGYSIPAPTEIAFPEYVLTVDDLRGFSVYSNIVTHFGHDHFTPAEIIAHLHANNNLVFKRQVSKGF